MKIKIWNYRNYSISNPIEIEINEGITFVLGPNNVGKTNLLRFFNDFRELFRLYSQNGQISHNSFQMYSAFDSILTRGTDKKLIKFRVSDGGTHLEVTIEPKSTDLHTKEVQVKTELNVNLDLDSETNSSFPKICKVLANTYCIGVNRNNNFASNNINHTNNSNYDISINQEFLNTWMSWSDGDDTIKREKISSLMEELREFFSFKKFNIRSHYNRNTLLVTTPEGDFSLTDMGSGLSQYIVMLATILFQQPDIVIIDEPEMNLHPKMQETFIRALSSKVKFGIVALSHSVGLARSVADRIYSMTSLENGAAKISEFGLHHKSTISQSIGEMSYSQFVEIGGNNILLVEGQSDIKAFREILRKYKIENKFIIFTLGGKQFINKADEKIDELNETKRLNPNSISVIFDSEYEKEGDKLTEELILFKETCESLGFNVFPTDKHSTENYVSQEVIDQELGSHIKALSKYENFNKRENSQKWNKSKNWLLFLKMKKSDFEGTELDKFITNTLIPLTLKN